MMVQGEYAVVVYEDRYLPGPGNRIARHVVAIYAGAASFLEAEAWAKRNIAPRVAWEAVPTYSISQAAPERRKPKRRHPSI